MMRIGKRMAGRLFRANFARSRLRMPPFCIIVLAGRRRSAGRAYATAINKTYLIDDFLADARNQNLDKAVHLDVGYDPKDPAGETRWLQGGPTGMAFRTGSSVTRMTCSPSRTSTPPELVR